MTTDSIGDFIVKLKNAAVSRKETVTTPYSKLKLAIAEVLEKEGYITTITKKGKKIAKTLEVTLVYKDGAPKLNNVERVSKPSKRMYQAVGDIKLIQSGFGHLILSTSKGVLTGRDARKENVGGEPLFKIW